MKNLNEKLILIIDDNPVNLMLTSKILDGHGYITSVADSGRLGIEKIKKEIPALILLDIMMPDMDGYEVCRKIKENREWKEIPIIFLTSNVMTEGLVEGFKAGAVDYIIKSFTSEELLARIKNHLELANSRKTIIEMNRLRDKLYSIIAHDIRSPLSGILQTVEAIDQGFVKPASDDFKDIIHQLKIRTKETDTLLKSLLLWTRMQDRRPILESKILNLNNIIKSCIQLFDANARDKNITLINELPHELFAYCDEVSISAIFRNLISNAIKFTPSGGWVRISSEKTISSIKLSIQDNGIGMSEETIHKILKMNHHYTSLGTNNEQGTGLGLMIVKDFLKLIDGTLEIESSVGKGTTFTIHLPLFITVKNVEVCHLQFN